MSTCYWHLPVSVARLPAVKPRVSRDQFGPISECSFAEKQPLFGALHQNSTVEAYGLDCFFLYVPSLSKLCVTLVLVPNPFTLAVCQQLVNCAVGIFNDDDTSPASTL